MVKVLVIARDGKPDILHIFEDEGEQADYYHFTEIDCPCSPALGETDSGDYMVTHRSFVKAVRW